jgi:hypothetical protein
MLAVSLQMKSSYDHHSHQIDCLQLGLPLRFFSWNMGYVRILTLLLTREVAFCRTVSLSVLFPHGSTVATKSGAWNDDILSKYLTQWLAHCTLLSKWCSPPSATCLLYDSRAGKILEHCDLQNDRGREDWFSDYVFHSESQTVLSLMLYAYQLNSVLPLSLKCALIRIFRQIQALLYLNSIIC